MSNFVDYIEGRERFLRKDFAKELRGKELLKTEIPPLIMAQEKVIFHTTDDIVNYYVVGKERTGSNSLTKIFIVNHTAKQVVFLHDSLNNLQVEGYEVFSEKELEEKVNDFMDVLTEYILEGNTKYLKHEPIYNIKGYLFLKSLKEKFNLDIPQYLRRNIISLTSEPEMDYKFQNRDLIFLEYLNANDLNNSEKINYILNEENYIANFFDNWMVSNKLEKILNKRKFLKYEEELGDIMANEEYKECFKIGNAISKAGITLYINNEKKDSIVYLDVYDGLMCGGVNFKDINEIKFRRKVLYTRE